MSSRLITSIQKAFDMGYVPHLLIGKKPLMVGWADLTMETCRKQILDAYKEGIDYNIGVVCGEPSKIIVVDVDKDDAGLELWFSFLEIYGPIDTFTVKTGSGFHYYFKYDDKTKVLKNMTRAIDGKGIDIRTNRGQVVFVGSIHPEKKTEYTVYHEPQVNKNAEMPDWLLTMLITGSSTGQTLPTITKPLFTDGIQKLIDGYTPSPISERKEEGIAQHLIEYGQMSTDITKTQSLDMSREELSELIDLLSFHRSDNHECWLKGIWAIRNTNDDFDDLAHKFSKKSPKYKEWEVTKLWNDKKPQPDKKITAGTLNHWLKEDIGVEQYKKFKYKWRTPKVKVETRNKSEIKVENIQEEKVEDIPVPVTYMGQQIIDLYTLYIDRKDDGLAEYYTKMMKPVCVCVDYEKEQFYYWKPSKLLWEKGGRKMLYTSIYNIVNDMLEVASQFFLEELGKINKDDKNAEKKMTEFKFKLQTIAKARGRVGIVSGKNAILNIASYLLCDASFANDINKMYGVLPVRDGLLIDLKTGDVRERTIEDKFSFECPVTYDPSVNMTDINRYFDDVSLGNNKKLLQTILGYSIIGGNECQKIIILHNPEGGASKSTLMNLLFSVLGQFYSPGERHLAFRTKGAMRSEGGHTEYKTQLEERRIVSFCESSSSIIAEDHLDEAFLKMVSGDDPVSGRGLYEQTRVLKMWFLPFLIVNKLPTVSNDEAFWRRLIVVKMKVKFVSKPNPQNPFEKKVDPDFIRRLKSEENKSAFLNWLIEGAKLFHKNGLPDDDDFEIQKILYQTDNDKVLQFVYDTCEIKAGDVELDFCEECANLWTCFQQWRRQSGNGSVELNRIKTKNGLTAALTGKKILSGINEEEEENGSKRKIVLLEKGLHSITRRTVIYRIKLKTSSESFDILDE